MIVELGGTSTDIGGWLDPHAATATWVLPLAGSALSDPTGYDVPPVKTPSASSGYTGLYWTILDQNDLRPDLSFDF